MGERWRFLKLEQFRSLWFLPTVFVALSLLAGAVLSNIEIPEDSFLSDLLFRGDASNARQLLTVVSGTMITVTGLVFVLTVIALQIASTQFSPRLLRFFLRDVGTRLVLSTFVATFAYSLAGLFTVGRETDTGEEFLPQLAVSGALLLALISVGMLVFYIQHITNSIRIDTVMRGVETATLEAIHRLHPVGVEAEVETRAAPHPSEAAVLIPIDRPGYVEGIDIEQLAAIAEAHGAVVRIRSQIGHHLVDGSYVGWAWPVAQTSDFDAEDVISDVNAAIQMRNERIEENDIGFGLRQLVDVAIKAVSPSVNDPYTSVQAVQHLAVVLTALGRVRTDDQFQVDAEGGTRVHIPIVDFEQHLGTVCSNVRQAASNRPRVMEALLRMLESIAAGGTTADRRRAISSEIDLVLSDAEREIPQPADFAPVRAMGEAAHYAARTGTIAAVG